MNKMKHLANEKNEIQSMKLIKLIRVRPEQTNVRQRNTGHEVRLQQ